MVPGAILLGVGASPMWSAKCTYLTHIGEQYSLLTGEDKEVVITRYFGIFFLFFQSTQVAGNLISSLVLSYGDDGDSEISDEDLENCGANFCQGDGAIIDISNKERYMLSSIYLVFALTSSVVVMVFVAPLRKYGGDSRVGSATGRSPKEQVVAAFHHMKHPYRVPIIPLTFWSGVEQAFIGADYTAAYVSCSLGVGMLGYTMICFGVCNALCSFFCSSAVRAVGRVPVFAFASALNLALILVLLLWTPDPDQLYVFFVIPGLWGVADAVWQTQINSLYSVLFPKEAEAAFSNYKLWESLGFILAYICSTLLCVAA